MNYQAIRDVLHEHFKDALERHKARLAQQGRIATVDRDAFNNGYSLATHAINKTDYSLVGTDAEMARLIDTYELPIAPEDEKYALLRTEFLKAFRDYCTSALQADDALAGYDFKATVSTTAPAPQKQVKLADAIATYCDDKTRLKQWSVQSVEGYRAQFNLLLRYLGEDASLHIAPELATDVKTMLLRLPKHSNKKEVLKHLSIAELLALNTPEAERLSVVSVNKHLTTYSAFYDWAVKQKRTNENNFAALVDNVKKAYNIRAAFGANDIQRILQVVSATSKPHHKWGVLIAFYTGARLNEIAQLESTDIIQEDGIWCFNFTNEGDNKRLKNDASKRIIPIHSKLIELGFLDYANHAGKGRLFAGLSYHPKDGYGRNLGRWFNDSLLRKQLAIHSPSLVFHSIRHTVAQQLRNNDVQAATLKDILGHTHEGVTMAVYAKKLNKAVMRDAIETLAYA